MKGMQGTGMPVGAKHAPSRQAPIIGVQPACFCVCFEVKIGDGGGGGER